MAEVSLPAFSGYQKRLFALLSVATFFQGYNAYALASVLPSLTAEFALSSTTTGQLVTFRDLGAVASYFLVRNADRWGRRRVLMITIVGFTLATLVSGLAWSIVSFAIAQFVAQLFLTSESVVSIVYAAEEFPARRRGVVVGIISGAMFAGAIVCAAGAPLLLASQLGWRLVYLVGAVPLVLMVFLRRNLKETSRFSRVDMSRVPQGLERLWKSGYGRRLLAIGGICVLSNSCVMNAVTFWKQFAVSERGLTDAQVGLAIALASLVALPLILGAGKILDAVGRRSGAILVFGLCGVGVFGSYTLHHWAELTAALTLCIFGAGGVSLVINAISAELFPTEIRGDAFALTNNLLGYAGYLPSPVLIGWFAGSVGWGAALRPTVLLLAAALVLILASVQETTARELEETAAL